MTYKYQLIALGPSRRRILPPVRTALRKAIQDLGLSPQTDFEVVLAARQGAITPRGSVVSIWFGGTDEPSQVDLTTLDILLKEGLPVIPVVEDLEAYRDNVPPALLPINGINREPLAAVVADVLRALTLTREQRQAFISYRRKDSHGLALQLFHGLTDHGYRAFLDTASVEAGADFQTILWDRMADVDLVIFLDTPNALSSEWVHKELARVNNLGLGALQIVWPDHTPTAGTEFSFNSRFLLKHNDFHGARAKPNKEIRHDVLCRIVAMAEQARISSLGMRRMRVVGELVDQARERNLKPVVQPWGSVEFQRGRKTVATALPVVGLPDAWAIHLTELDGAKRDIVINDALRVVYHGLGVKPQRANYLSWLNDHLRLKTLRLEDLDEWWKEVLTP